MTIEQKAAAYDETIEKLRDFYRDYDTVSCLIDVKEELAHLVPEIKESEDECVEKIKKDIILYLKNRQITYIAESNATEKWIAWLEKHSSSQTKE